MTTEAEAVAKLAKSTNLGQIVKSEDSREFLLSAKDVDWSDISDPHFQKLSGAWRLVVEDDRGLLLIMSEKNIEPS